jgi:outer membrane protein
VQQKLNLTWVIFGLAALLQLATAAPGFAKTEITTGLSLNQCLKLAYQNSETLKTAVLKVTKARHSLKQAEAELTPSLKYNVYGQKSDREFANDYYGGLTLSQTVYAGGKIKAGLEEARLELTNAMEGERQVKQELTYDVKAAFYQFWLAGQKLQVARASSDNMERHFHNYEKKYQEGTISHYDLLQAEVNWKKLLPEVIAAQNALNSARLDLGVLIGVKSDFNITAAALAATAPKKTTLTLEKGLATAYRDRPEMRQQQNNLEIAALDLKIAKGDYYPTLTASGSYESSSADSGTDWDQVWALKLDLSGTLFNGNKTKAKVAAAAVDLKVAESSERQLRDTIRVALENGLQTLDESSATIAAHQANIVLMQNALKLTQAKLEEGLADSTDLMDAQVDLDETLDDYYSAITDYLTAAAKLDLFLGRDIK